MNINPAQNRAMLAIGRVEPREIAFAGFPGIRLVSNTALRPDLISNLDVQNLTTAGLSSAPPIIKSPFLRKLFEMKLTSHELKNNPQFSPENIHSLSDGEAVKFLAEAGKILRTSASLDKKEYVAKLVVQYTVQNYDGLMEARVNSRDRTADQLAILSALLAMSALTQSSSNVGLIHLLDALAEFGIAEDSSPTQSNEDVAEEQLLALPSYDEATANTPSSANGNVTLFPNYVQGMAGHLEDAALPSYNEIHHFVQLTPPSTRSATPLQENENTSL